MKILFDLTALFDHLTGIERFAINIAKNIVLHHPENHYILVFKNEIHSDFRTICKQNNVTPHVLSACHKFLFHQWRLMRYLYTCKADRYVFLSFVSPWLFRSSNIINTIHDISAWDCPGTRKKYMVIYGKIGIKNAIHVSKNLVTVSEFSKTRIVDRLKVNPNSVMVVYNGVSNQFLDLGQITIDRIREVKSKYNLPDRYYLCLSTLEPRKNMRLLIDAFIQLKSDNTIDCDLVLAGRKGWKLDSAIGKDKEIIDKFVHVTGFIEDDDLPVIYSLANAFVFPSIYEGFGIPIIEAMSCNTIVVSSDSSSLPEVVGNAGILFKSNSLEELKKALKRVSSMNEEERNEFIIRGKNRCRRFDWQVEAEKYYSVIQK